MSWVESELAGQNMGDTRLNKRIATLITALSIEPSRSLPCANDTWTETLAAKFDGTSINLTAVES